MKHFKLISALMLTVFLTSCGGDNIIEGNVVIEQVDVSDREGFSYKVKIQSNCECGDIFYYTNYKHQVGDTLVSIFEFTDNRENLLKNEKAKSDSISTSNDNLVRKNEELSTYNELLMGIIKESAKKQE